MTFRLGLTGSIGMGKSTTAQMFADAGCPVWDADAVVHRLYGSGGGAVAAIAEHFPQAIEDNAVSRDKLRALIRQDPSVLDRIQSMVHPLVAADRQKFVADNAGQIVILDIPLLFETGAEAQCDAIAVVSVDAATQRQRVLDRGEMSVADFEVILERQTPDADKRARADYLIVTDTLDHAREQVHHILTEIRESLSDA